MKYITCNEALKHVRGSPLFRHEALKVRQGIPDHQNTCAGDINSCIQDEYLLNSVPVGTNHQAGFTTILSSYSNRFIWFVPSSLTITFTGQFGQLQEAEN